MALTLLTFRSRHLIPNREGRDILQQFMPRSVSVFLYFLLFNTILCLAQVTVADAATVTTGNCSAKSALGTAVNGISVSATMAPNSAVWAMCVVQDAAVGIIISDVTLTPPSKDGGIKTKILSQASLSQIVLTPSGKSSTAVIGQSSAISWSAQANDCLNPAIGSLPSGLCVQVAPRGYAWRGSNGLVQGESLIISTAGALSGDVYFQKWVFDEDGSIHPSLGVGRQIASGSIDRFVTALWRLNFLIDNGNSTSTSNIVEQIDYQACLSPYLNCSNTRSQTVTGISTGRQVQFNPNTQNFWRIRSANQKNSNGWPISYEILTHQTALDRQAITFDVAFTDTTSNSCVIRTLGLVSEACSVLHLASETQSISSPVAWMVTTAHQISATQAFYDQGFHVRARDLTPTSPLL